MEIYSNPLYVTRVAGPGTNIFIEENEGYEVFCNNVTKSSTKDKEKIQKLLNNLRPKPWRSEKCFYQERKKPY